MALPTMFLLITIIMIPTPDGKIQSKPLFFPFKSQAECIEGMNEARKAVDVPNFPGIFSIKCVEMDFDQSDKTDTKKESPDL